MRLFENIDDSELVRKINSGEKRAYQELFERYAPRIYQFAKSYLKNRPDAEELVQDVFLKLWEKRELLDHSKNVKAFVYKVAVNSIYDFIRRKNIENAFRDFISLQPANNENNTWHQVILDDLMNHLDELLLKMPEQQRRIFKLSREEGLTNDEIAAQLNLSKRTIENHLYRAVAYLKENFKSDTVFSVLFFYLFCN